MSEKKGKCREIAYVNMWIWVYKVKYFHVGLTLKILYLVRKDTNGNPPMTDEPPI